MAILEATKDKAGGLVISSMESKLTPAAIKKGQYEVSPYSPSQEEKDVRSMILRHFTLGYTNMYTPRVEFNDLPVINRMQVDQMAFNTYQSNNGQPMWGDEVNAWRSNAMRPVVRNKCVSIAAHATARLIFPKVFAYNDDSDEQKDAGTVMEDLMEWAADQSNYAQTSLYRTITALTDPASIGYTEYCEVYRDVKRPNGEGGYTKERIVDETLSGFQDIVVPVDELFIENFYEQNIQKQAWLIWRKVISYSLAETKYRQYENFKYVNPGVQVLYNDANQSFYQVYDTNMRPYDVEEVTYWNRALDLKIVIVNGVMMTPHDNPNPRNDKLYPFDKFGYEMINNRCFYYKSLAFKLQQDADIVNTLYPMVIDGTYLNLMPPMIQIGDEMIGSDVMVPGSVHNLTSPNADLKAVSTQNDLKAGLTALATVEESLNESSQEPLQQGDKQPGSMTAYEISRLEQNAATVLGLFIKMISQHVKDFGKLRMGDILQYLTIADVNKITDNAPLVYKTFLMHDRQNEGKTQTRKIRFSDGMTSEPMTSEQQMSASYDVLDEGGGDEVDVELWKVNPELFRNLTYMLTVSPDVLNPKSEDLIRAFDLETYDRLIANPMADQDEALRLLLSTNPKTKRNPDKYIMEQQPGPMGLTPQQAAPLGMGMGQKPQQPLPQVPTTGTV